MKENYSHETLFFNLITFWTFHPIENNTIWKTRPSIIFSFHKTTFYAILIIFPGERHDDGHILILVVTKFGSFLSRFYWISITRNFLKELLEMINFQIKKKEEKNYIKTKH